MKQIGLLGGMSWESTVTYYQIINRTIGRQLGGLHSAKCLLYSVDFSEIEVCQRTGDWDRCAALLTDAAQKLERAGADMIAICTNTMHRVADAVAQGIGIPLVHIADPTIAALKDRGIRTVGLLGTKYTMTQDFYRAKLEAAGIAVAIPAAADIERVNDVIYTELCAGKMLPVSKAYFLSAIDDLARGGAEGVILGCTEIGSLVGQQDTAVPLFDTTQLHAEAVALRALQ